MHTYLFDFDGTLVDSMPTFSSIMYAFLDEYSIEYGDNLINIITPLGYRGIAEYFSRLGVPLPAGEIQQILMQRAVAAYTHRIPAKDFVIPVLRQLHSHGYSLNVLTASPHDMLDPCLRRLGIWELFDHVWSCNDFSTTKSDPQIYIHAAQHLGVSVDSVLFLDDNIHSIQTALVAGMRTCAVYDASSADSVMDMKRLADYYIYDFSQLPNLA